MRTMERFVTSARPETIWQVLTDVEHWPNWTPTVTQVEPLDNDGLRIGAQYRVTQPQLRPAVYEVTDCTPEKVFTWVQRFPGGVMVADHRIGAWTGSTEVELSFRSEGLVGGLMGMIFSRKIREYVATEARSLKQRSESLMSLR